MTDASGALISEQRYLPFGEVRTDVGEITQTDFGYTFQRGLPGTGLMDYRARFYAPYLNHFTQPDSIVPEPGNPQALNRYSYALNNSIRYNDPDGHSVDCGLGDPYCKAGRIDFERRANDLLKEKRECAKKGTTLFWLGLSDQERLILEEHQISEGVYHDSLLGGVSKADKWHDPTTYIVAAFTGGGFLRAGYGLLKSTITVIAGGAGYASVNTPYGPASQSTTQQALQARQSVQGGANLFKLGTLGPSNGVESQFWSLENPLINPGYANQYGVPSQNLASNNTFLLVGQLKDTATFITRESPGYGG